MAKKLKIGNLLVEKKTDKNGKEYISRYLGLGSSKNRDPKYDLSVELVIRDHTGNVVHTQKNGFLTLVDLRTQPDDLLAAGLIDESRYDKMKEGLSRLPDRIKYSLELNVK